jgi:hypothetical protein
MKTGYSTPKNAGQQIIGTMWFVKFHRNSLFLEGKK